MPARAARRWSTGTFGIRNGVVNHGGAAADLRPQGAGRGFTVDVRTPGVGDAFYRAGWHTASISSFPFRHSATWWNHGFMEAMNLMRGMGGERADEVLPGALDWLDRNGAADDWFLHVHLWDPHTPYNTPDDYGNPFAGDPIPAWHTEEVRAGHWELPGPHSAQEPWGFQPDESAGRRLPASRGRPDMDAVKRMFDGYDVGVRYADDAVGTLVEQARRPRRARRHRHPRVVRPRRGVRRARRVRRPPGRRRGDLPHPGRPALARAAGRAWSTGLQYHLDVAATVVELAGIEVPVDHWDGRSVAAELRPGRADGRDHLVVSQGAWAASVRSAGATTCTCAPGTTATTAGPTRCSSTSPPTRTRAPTSPATGPTSSPTAGTCWRRGPRTSWRGRLAGRPDGHRDGRGRPVPHPRHLPAYLERLRATGRGELGRPSGRPPPPVLAAAAVELS